MMFRKGQVMKQKKTAQFYRIRKTTFWGLIGGLILLIGAAYFRNDLHEKWLEGGGWEDISFTEMESKLKNGKECYLCGSSDRSLMDYYRKFDTVGVISLNDWYVLDLKLKSYDGKGNEIEGEKGSSTSYGNTGEISYMSQGSPARGMASMDITLPENYKLHTDTIQHYLCQKCLDKITESLGYSKWRYEKKEAIPLCLVDFKTLEIYSLQDWHRGCTIRDYWVEMEPEGNEIEIKAFYLPYDE